MGLFNEKTLEVKDPQNIAPLIAQTETVRLASGVDNGWFCPISPKISQTAAEKVIKGHSNAFIVLGQDRDGGIASGKGGVGFSDAAAIDIIVGISGKAPAENIGGEEVATPKSFKNDSCRVYLSKRTDLDAYFEIPKFSVQIDKLNTFKLEENEDTAGIGIKSDHVRVVARENIKLVTAHYGTNQKGRKGPADGVYLIAGYDKMSLENVTDSSLSIEPMVKGTKLANFLERVIHHIGEVQLTLANYIKLQMDFNRTLLKHKHQSGSAGYQTSKMTSEQAITSLIEMTRKIPQQQTILKIRNELIKQYLQNTSKEYINSLYHKLN